MKAAVPQCGSAQGTDVSQYIWHLPEAQSASWPMPHNCPSTNLQREFAQTVVLPHVLPHIPQLLLSVAVDVHPPQ